MHLPHFDAEVLINFRMTVHHVYGFFRADFYALVGKASLAGAGDHDFLFRAAMAGKGDNVNERLVIVLCRYSALYRRRH